MSSALVGYVLVGRTDQHICAHHEQRITRKPTAQIGGTGAWLVIVINHLP